MDKEFGDFKRGKHPLSKIFRKLDQDGNGLLDFEEFYHGLKLLGSPMPEGIY